MEPIMNTSRTLNRRLFAASAGALVAGMASTAAIAAANKTDRNDPTRANEAAIRRLYDAVNKKELDVIASYGAPFSEWLDVPFDYTTTGVNAIIDPWKSWFDIFPDATCEVRSLAAMGEYVVAQGIGRGTQRGVFNSPAGVIKPTGRAMKVAFCDVYRLRAGKILRADSYFDFFGLVNQLVQEPFKVS
jgi:ketosteroid isomerase-like protein